MVDLLLRPRCMIVEDQALIGMSLEASLEEMGFRTEGPFMSSAQALQWLSSETPNVALLDFMIKDGTSLEIARALKSRRIPFAIYSGLSPRIDCPPELRDVPWLEKPASREMIAAMLEEIISSNAAGAPAKPRKPDGEALPG